MLNCLLVLSPILALAGQSSPLVISGTICASNQSPVVGANAKLFDGDNLIGWAITDTSGKFTLKADTRTGNSMRLEIGAIGHQKKILPITAQNNTPNITITLAEKPIEVAPIIVKSSPRAILAGERISSEKIALDSRRSIVSTNSASAIKQPQAVREGSGQSAKIRVNGTNPLYFINGAEIGNDPNHYGMFNIIASPLLSSLDFYAQGTPCKYESPSAIEFHTPEQFAKHFKSELDFSFIEGTVLASAGNARYFVLTSLRKSFLDLLLKEAPFHSDRLTIPPTSFADYFISSGIQLAPHYRLITDQYYTRDYFAYDLSATQRNPSGMKIAQNTDEQFMSLRLESTYPNLNIRLEVSTKSSQESYSALPAIESVDSTMMVDLDSKQRISMANIETNYLLGNTIVTFGNGAKYIASRKLNLRQKNWNFLPPDATSDNPYIYQPELNYLYGTYSSSDDEFDNASFASIKSHFGRFEYEIGAREAYFQNLQPNWKTTYRGSLGFDMGKAGNISAFAGTFAELPVKRILDPYQVLIIANLRRLSPINTELLALTYSVSALKLGVFAKNIDHLPVLSPDFNPVDINGQTLRDLLATRSTGLLRSYGGDIVLDLKDFLARGLDTYFSYGYTHASKVIDDVTIPYELNAPHKINIETDYQVSALLTIGGNIAAHSGYPYTRPVEGYFNYTVSRYTQDYYRGILGSQNSSRFSLNFQTAIYADLNWGRSRLYLTIINITNRKNPLISSADGFIYDNGILPSLGYSRKF